LPHLADRVTAMQHPFPLKTQNKFFFFARNPEDECDGRWFRFEEDAFNHFLEYGKHYHYTAINEGDGSSEFLNDEFEERLGDAA
jgi:hypothetical protein